MNKVHYTYIACDEFDKDGNYKLAVELNFDLVVVSEEEAEKYARTLIKRNHYTLRAVRLCQN